MSRILNKSVTSDTFTGMTEIQGMTSKESLPQALVINPKLFGQMLLSVWIII